MCAATYVKREHIGTEGRMIRIVPAAGVRYTVPQMLHPDTMADQVIVRFRVGKPYRNCRIRVAINGDPILCKKRPVMAPGEMESIVLEKKIVEEYPGVQEITIRIEEA